MKVLITGGAGFIGTKLAQRLIADDHSVILVDSLSPQIHGDIPDYRPPEGATFKRLDVRQLAERTDLLEGTDVVYHLAAETGTAQSMYQIAEYVDVNGMGTAALLEALAKLQKRPARVILASSRSIYGEGAYEAPSRPGQLIHPRGRTREQLAAGNWDFSENGEILQAVATPEHFAAKPSSVYAATKMAQELLLTSSCESLGITPVLLRFQNVYGEGQSLRNPYTGVISIFFNRARQGLEINVYEDGKESRDFVHVEDIVSALVLVMKADVAPGSCYNVGSGMPTSLLELANTLVSASGTTAPIRISGDYRLGDIRHCFADISAIRRDLGFQPVVDLNAGLQRFVTWAKSQPEYQDLSDKAAAELRERGLAKV
ncbi:NAD-dependent epimerase/dehydratase family protein [Rhizobium sp. AG855]|uniref:NAD-dependent epimerase/dehydratase family protein n=1 Tax=Rhizobium sp. AG855 TaxID=2183898 RepID=UPI000E743446|nr:NAD-dependent epimerase/dehydratase family protein [Rhizobium sp. AG855]RKE85554.1 dTDP-L-rhamnose 4-epimerase [Rhizobium sp. AG855]